MMDAGFIVVASLAWLIMVALFFKACPRCCSFIVRDAGVDHRRRHWRECCACGLEW